MLNTDQQIYIIGYGNRFRQDDAVGPLLADILSFDEIPGTIVIDRPTLTFEDAYDIAVSSADVVLFIDASVSGMEPFCIYPVEPSAATSISIPMTTPSAVLHLCETAFNRKVRGYIMGIRGYEWEFSQAISEEAAENLKKAYVFIREIIEMLSSKRLSINKFDKFEGCVS